MVVCEYGIEIEMENQLVYSFDVVRCMVSSWEIEHEEDKEGECYGG